MSPGFNRGVRAPGENPADGWPLDTYTRNALSRASRHLSERGCLT
ncbi:hypothetical protein OHA77_16350 [Streptosporangium sp. NBC_01639]|nr:hypothetical protein OHA77_16350 [Streptosporangium sp. NBC_01639]